MTLTYLWYAWNAHFSLKYSNVIEVIEMISMKQGQTWKDLVTKRGFENI